SRGAPMVAARNEQGRLGEAIAGIERRTTETARSERLDETIDRVAPNGFRPAIGQAPLAQIQLLAFRGGDFPDTQVEREVRAAADGPSVPRERFQPSTRTLQERQRRH